MDIGTDMAARALICVTSLPMLRARRWGGRRDRQRDRGARGAPGLFPRAPASVAPTSVRWKFMNERDAVGPRCPWYRFRYGPVP